MSQGLFAVCVTILLAAPACTAPGAASRKAVARKTTEGQTAEEKRALLPLSELSPLVSKPTRPADLAPLSERAAAQLAEARTLAEQERFTEAALRMERALRFAPNHPDIQSALAVLQWRSGNIERARQHADRALQVNPDDGWAHYTLGRCAAADQARGTAILSYRKGLLSSQAGEDQRLRAQSALALAEALALEGYLTAALEAYEMFEGEIATAALAESDDPQWQALVRQGAAASRKARASLLERLGRFAEAASTLEPLAVQQSADLEIRVVYARLLAAAGQTTEALSFARRIESSDDQVLQLLRDIHAATGHSENFVADLRERLVRRPDSVNLVTTLADVLAERGRVEEARQCLEEFLNAHPAERNVRDRLIELLASRGRWQEVLDACARAIDSDPERASYYEARAYERVSDPAAARALVEKVPPEESSTGLYLRGVLAGRQGSNRHAEALFRRALAQDPASIAPRAALAELLSREYRYDEALAVAARSDPNVPEHARLERILGLIHERLDDLNQAQTHYQAAIHLDRTDIASMFELAMVYRRLGDDLSSRRQLRLLLERDPAHDRAREQLIVAYMNEGKLDVASEQIEALQRHEHSPLAKARGRAFLELVHNRNAAGYRQALLDAIQMGPADAATWTAIAESFSEFEQDKAKEAYRKALELDADHEPARLGLIFAHTRLLEFESAIQEFERLAPRRPHRHEWRLGWQDAGWRLGLLDLYTAVQDHQAALALARRFTSQSDLEEGVLRRYRLAELRALTHLDRGDEVLALLKEWSTDEGEQPIWTRYLAREYLRRKQPDVAVKLHESLYAKRPDNDAALSDLVGALVAADRFHRALQYVLDWLGEDPDRDDALHQLLYVLALAKQTDQALELVDTKLTQTRDRERFQDLRTLILDEADRHEQAADWIESLLSAVLQRMHELQTSRRAPAPESTTPARILYQPNEPATPPRLEARLVELRSHLAAQLIAARDYRLAQQRLREWLDATGDPRSRFMYLARLASSYRNQGDEASATDVLEQALALQPDHVGLNNDVAYGWIDRGIRLDRAERMIRYALSREPFQMAYLDTYGWLGYKRGRFDEARKWVERAIRAAPQEDPVIHDHLGDVLWRLGQNEAAISHWTKGLDLARQRKDQPMSGDERRVLSTTGKKIEDARSGRQPDVAELARPDADADDAEHSQPPIESKIDPIEDNDEPK